MDASMFADCLRQWPMAVNRLRLRLFVAAVLLSVSAAYTVGVVSGAVTGEKKIDAVHLALLALTTILCVVVVRPESLERLRLFEIGGVRLEMLEKVREKQHEQESELEDIRLMLPLLLPERERSHLVNLADGKTQYKANANVRGELRRLRYVG